MPIDDQTRKAEDALRTNEHMLRSMIRYGKDIMTLIGPDGKVKYRSPSYGFILGYSEEEMESMSIFETVHPDDIEGMKENMKLLMTHPGQTLDISWRQRHQSGNYKWMEGTGTNLLNEPDVNALVCNFRDVTDHVIAQQNLADKNTELNRLFNSIDEVIYSTTRNPYLLTQWSEACQKIYGYSSQEFLEQQRLWYDVILPEDRHVIDELNKVLQTGAVAHGEYRIRHRDGSIRWIEASITPTLDTQRGIIIRIDGVNRDITEKKKAEEDLQNSEMRFRTLIENSKDVISLSTAEQEIIYISPAIKNILGYEPEELLGVNSATLMHREETDAIHVERSSLKPGESKNLILRALHKNGSWRWLEVMVTNKLENPAIRAMVSNLRDITERKIAEEALADSERKFRTLIENNKDVISLSDAKRTLLYISPAIKDILGYEPEELIGLDSASFLHPGEIAPNLARRETLLPDQSQNFTIQARHKDGSWRWLEVVVTNKLDDPAVKALVSNLRDVTDQKQAEEALSNSEKRFRTMIEKSNEIIAITDRDRIISYISPSLKDILGYETTELIGMSISDLYHDDDKGEMKELIAALIRDEIGFLSHPLRVRHKNGSWRWLEASVTNQLNNPAIHGLVGNLRDVTANKMAEEVLQNSERKFRTLIENNGDVISMSDADRKIIYASPSIERVLGYKPEELIGVDSSTLMHPDEVGDNKALRTQIALGTSVSKSIRLRHKDGSWRWVDMTSANELADPAINAMVVNFRDVTERKNAEEALQNSEKRFRTLIENNKEGIALSNRDRQFTYVSPSVKNILGYDPEDLIGIKAVMLYHPDDQQSMKDLVASIMDKRKLHGTNLVRIRHRDGKWRWIEITATNQFDDPAVNAMVTNFRDVTERKQADEALQHSEQRFKSLIEKNQDVIALSAADGTIVYMSPSTKEMLDYEPEELKGTSAMALMHPDELEENIQRLIWVNENPGKPMFLIMRMRHKDGSWRWLEATSTSQLDNPAVNAIVSNLRDITARKEAQDELLLLNQSLEKKVEERTMQLAESNKALESFSSMAAHDLQAPLRVLSGYTSMVKHDYAENLGEEGAALLDVIMKQTKHMTQLVSDLLTFSRASHTIMKEEKVDLDAMVHELSDELCLINSTRKTPEIKIGDLGSTSCDAHLIRQVWSNLISNALKYSGKRDKPQIEIGRMPGEEEVIYYVKDNGAGFDARHQHKLFQVFQRLHTSSDFEGTGVGLALVKNVISRHGGRVWAESELDKGATFYFSMPA